MPLELTRQSLEIEKLAGAQRAQVLLRAEALVPGAGREAIEALMAEAGVSRDDVFALSKSPAAKAAYLTRVGHGTAVTDKGTGEVLKAEVIWEEAKGDEP